MSHRLHPHQAGPARGSRAGLLVIVALGLLQGCGREPAEPPPARAAAAALELSPTDVLTAQMAELTRGVAVSGSLKAVDSAVVKAQVAAELVSLTVREGDRVKAGQIIGRLDPREVRFKLAQAREQAAAARAQLDNARRTLDSNRALVQRGFISQNALDTSVSNADGARANLQAAEAAVDLARKALDDTTLRAPIKGLVAQRLAQPGERVAVDGRIVEIVDLSRMELGAALTPQAVAQVRTGQHATLRVDGIDTPLAARVARINPSAQAGSRAVLVYLAVQPHPALRQGLFATGRIDLEQRQALVVPESAVHTDQAEPYVLTIEPQAGAGRGLRVVQRRVRLGAHGRVGDLACVELLSGVAPGAQLLAASVGLVPDGTPVRITTVAPAAPPLTPPAAPPAAPTSSAAAH